MNGVSNPYVRDNLKAAKEAGLEAQIYIFPCVSCGNPRKQIDDAIKHLEGLSYNLVWLDIKAPSKWHSNKGQNVQFISEMYDELKKFNKTLGVYTEQSVYYAIVEHWDGLKDTHLWYAHLNHQQNFDHFKPFNGWKVPYMKQHTITVDMCNTYIDLDYYP